MLNGRVADWLVAASDPTGPAALPGRRLRGDDTARLLQAAAAHGVLPAVLMNLRQTTDVEKVFITPNSRSDEYFVPLTCLFRPSRRERLRRQDRFSAAISAAQQRILGCTAISLGLRRQLAEIAEVMERESLPAMVVKGPAFADRIYAHPGLRHFTDLDLLVPARATEAAGQVLYGLGYRPIEQQGRKYRAGYGQITWAQGGEKGKEKKVPDPFYAGSVELHWDLVNSPSLQRGLSVQYDDLQLAAQDRTGGSPDAGRPSTPSDRLCRRASPAALLMIAAVHGAASHWFDRLCLLWDVCQVARGAAGAVDEDWLAEAVARTGCGRALAMGLYLCEKVLGEPACLQLRRRLGLPKPGVVSRLLLSRSVVLGRPTPFGRARRLAFRQLLKKR